MPRTVMLLFALVALAACQATPSTDVGSKDQPILHRMYSLASELQARRSTQPYVVRYYPDEKRAYVAVRAARPDDGYIVFAESRGLPGTIIKTPDLGFVLPDLDLARISKNAFIPAKTILLITQHRQVPGSAPAKLSISNSQTRISAA